jgi:hypothetical protein
MARPRSLTLLAVLALATTALAPSVARAATANRWTLVERDKVPLEYYQGLTHVGPSLFFVGVFEGGYLAGADLRERVRNSDLIPPDLEAATGFNHIGDPTYDRSEGGRLLAPMECYHPDQPVANTCGFGGIGVVDPATLAWRYWVRLDGADVPNAMWAEVSPDGSLLWTSSGSDLVAYPTADVSAASAASGPASAPIHPVRRLAGAVPPSGVTGAAFSGGRLLLAGADSRAVQIWSVDLTTGRRRLELRLPGVLAEAEGLDVVQARGGPLHWLLTPSLLPHPTYGKGHSELLTFVPAPARVAARVTVRGATIRVEAQLRYGGAAHALEGATVRAGGKAAVTNAAGAARVTLPAAPRHRFTVTVGKGELRRLALKVRPRG